MCCLCLMPLRPAHRQSPQRVFMPTRAQRPSFIVGEHVAWLWGVCEYVYIVAWFSPPSRLRCRSPRDPTYYGHRSRVCAIKRFSVFHNREPPNCFIYMYTYMKEDDFLGQTWRGGNREEHVRNDGKSLSCSEAMCVWLLALLMHCGRSYMALMSVVFVVTMAVVVYCCRFFGLTTTTDTLVSHSPGRGSASWMMGWRVSLVHMCQQVQSL